VSMPENNLNVDSPRVRPLTVFWMLFKGLDSPLTVKLTFLGKNGIQSDFHRGSFKIELKNETKKPCKGITGLDTEWQKYEFDLKNNSFIQTGNR